VAPALPTAEVGLNEPPAAQYDVVGIQSSGYVCARL
jgi:hypothetical protein